MGSATDSSHTHSHYIGVMAYARAIERNAHTEQNANQKGLPMDVPQHLPQLTANSSPYTAALMWAFLLSNGLRVFTYLPTIVKLLKPNVTGDCQSALTWLLWTLSNATLTLHLFEVNQRRSSDVIVFSAINTAMCLICLLLVYRVQARARSQTVRASPATWRPQQALLNRFRNQ
jgi:hypothetical protein